MPATKKSRTVKNNNRTIIMAVVVVFALIGAYTLGYSSARGRGGGSTLTIADGTYGGTTTATVTNPQSMTWIESTCTQSGAPVIYNRLATDPNGQAVLTLGPTDGYKTGVGGADCSAEAKYWHNKRQRWISLDTTNYRVTD